MTLICLNSKYTILPWGSTIICSQVIPLIACFLTSTLFLDKVNMALHTERGDFVSLKAILGFTKLSEIYKIIINVVPGNRVTIKD